MHNIEKDGEVIDSAFRAVVDEFAVEPYLTGKRGRYAMQDQLSVVPINQLSVEKGEDDESVMEHALAVGCDNVTVYSISLTVDGVYREIISESYGLSEVDVERGRAGARRLIDLVQAAQSAGQIIPIPYETQ